MRFKIRWKISRKGREGSLSGIVSSAGASLAFFLIGLVMFVGADAPFGNVILIVRWLATPSTLAL
jgi:hypothetical protein